MSENLYDVAYEIEKAIRASDEFKELQKVYIELNSDVAAKEMFTNFRNMQITMQEKQMMGEELAEEDVIAATTMISDVQENEKISKLLEVEERMGTVMTEINAIIIKPLEELYNSGE